MNTIPTSAVLDQGAKYLTNNPDHLAKRIALAQVLVATRAVKSLEAGVLAFRIWAEPTARVHTAEVILSIANERAVRS